jgi:hypothetical protein
MGKEHIMRILLYLIVLSVIIVEVYYFIKPEKSLQVTVDGEEINERLASLNTTGENEFEKMIAVIKDPKYLKSSFDFKISLIYFVAMILFIFSFKPPYVIVGIYTFVLSFVMRKIKRTKLKVRIISILTLIPFIFLLNPLFLL